MRFCFIIIDRWMFASRKMDETDILPKSDREKQKMELKTIDLYQHFALPAPTGAAGKLSCYIQHTPNTVSARRTRPAILILPGGGYSHTSLREAEPVALRFLSRGYVAFVLHYTCAPATFPTQLREAALAMRYIRENADAMEVDAHMVAAMGFSAGGHLCGTLGTLFDSPAIADIASPQCAKPDLLALCYPVAIEWGATHEGTWQNIACGDAALRHRLSLDRLVRADMPPVLLWHTRDDASVPVRNSLVLAQALDAAGVDFAMHIYRHGAHGLANADVTVAPAYALPEVSADVGTWLDAVLCFFAEKGFQIHDYEVQK